MRSRPVVLPFAGPVRRHKQVTSSRHFLLSISALAKRLAAAHEATVIVDFFETNPFPKLTTAQRFIALLTKQNSRRKPIILANVTPELFVSLAQAFLANTPVLTGFAVWPVIATDGSWRCLSALPGAIPSALAEVVRETGCSVGDLADRFALSESERQILIATCDANPNVFRYKAHDNTIHSVFRVADILDALLRYERKRLGDTVARRVIASGHFLLPSGLHADAIVQTYVLLQDPMLFSLVCTQIARHIWAAGPDVVMTFSNTSFLVAERLRRQQPFAIIHTFGYPAPRPRHGDHIREGQRVVILADIYSTGASLNHLRRLVVERGGSVAATIVVADAHGQANRDGVTSLFAFKVHTVTPGRCRRCRTNEPLEPVDPYSCLPYAPSRATIRLALLSQAIFWRLVRDHDAVRVGHRLLNGSHFDVFFEMRKVLRDQAARRELAAAAMANLPPVVDIITCPKNEGALLLASAVAEYLEHQRGTQPIVITASRDHANKKFVFPKLLHKRARGATILVLDDGANTGETLLGMHVALRDAGAASLHYLVCIDRLVGSDAEVVNAVLGRSVQALFHVPIPVYRAWDCPVCIRNAEQAYQPESGARNWALRMRTGEPTLLPDDVSSYGSET
jgi:orotate phosphoribosyltransferase